MRLLRRLDELGAITAVAEAEGLTRPAVSQQLAQLEAETGLHLVGRNGRRAVLTEEGRELVRTSARMFDEIDSVERHLEAQRAGIAGELRVSVFSSAAAHILPGALRALSLEHPELTVRVTENEPPDSLSDLAGNTTDVAIIDGYSLHPLDDQTIATPLLEDDLVAILPLGHPHAGLDRVPLHELRDEDWVISAKAAPFRAHLIATCRSHGFEPRITSECTQIETVVAMVRGGLGIAVLPQRAVAADDRSVVSRPLDPPMRRTILMAHSTSRPLHPAVPRLTAAILAHEGVRDVGSSDVTSDLLTHSVD